MREFYQLVSTFASGEDPLEVRSFCLQTGQADLQPYFAEVNLAQYKDALYVTDPDPLIDYIHSTRPDLQGMPLAELKMFVRTRIGEKGYFYITKESGMFECIKR